MERPNAWKKYDEAALAELDDLCERYRAFISDNKTERECVTASIKLAEAAGYTNLADAVERAASSRRATRSTPSATTRPLCLSTWAAAPWSRA